MAGQARARGQKQQKPPAGAKERFPSATAFAAVGFAVAAMVAAYASGPALQGLVGTASRAEPVTEPTPSSDVHEAAADAGAAVPTSAPTRPEPAKPTVTHADSPDCRDTSENCAAWAEHGECAKNSAYMRGACPKSCSACAGPVEEGPETSCKDLNDACATWARAGECESNPGYMIVECAHSCRTCHLRDPKVRCKRDPKEPQRLRPYRMGEIFRAVQAGKYDAQYGPVAVHSTSPWVVTFDHFLTEAECDEIVALMPPSKYERSSNVGGMTENGRFKASFDSTRTSENAWCDGACANASVMIEVARRVEDITGIPMPNAEYMCARAQGAARARERERLLSWGRCAGPLLTACAAATVRAPMRRASRARVRAAEQADASLLRGAILCARSRRQPARGWSRHTCGPPAGDV